MDIVGLCSHVGCNDNTMLVVGNSLSIIAECALRATLHRMRFKLVRMVTIPLLRLHLRYRRADLLAAGYVVRQLLWEQQRTQFRFGCIVRADRFDSLFYRGIELGKQLLATFQII